MALTARIVPVEDGDATLVGGGQRSRQFGLCLGDAFDGAKPAEVHRPHHRHNAHMRAGERTEAIDFAQVVHAHLEHSTLGIVAQPQQRQRQALFIVEIALRRQGAETLPHHAGGQFLGAGLAHAAGNADHTQVCIGAMQALKGADLLQCLRAVVHYVGDRLFGAIVFGQLGSQRPAAARAVDDGCAGLLRSSASTFLDDHSTGPIGQG